MSEVNIKSTNHVSFTVSDLTRTLSYLEDALGMEVLSDGPRDNAVIERVTGVAGADVRIAFVQAPGLRLELIEYKGPDEKTTYTPRPCDVGFAHVAFNVENFDDALARAKEHGVSPAGEAAMIDRGPNKGRRVVYLRDWDGLTIEFIEEI
ncbi:MAG: VOC family protein [Pseudomonadota bacterium]